MPNGGYSVKGIKTFEGREGYGFNATLLRDGVPVAFCIDAGNGGMVNIEWNDGRNGKEAVLLEAYCATLPPSPSGFTGVDPIPMCDEMFIAQLVDDEENRRRLVRLSKSKILFRLPTGNPDAWQYFKGKSQTPELKAVILRKHPDAIFFS